MGDFVVYKLHALEKIDLDDILTFVKPLLKDYIWHYNPFHLVQSDQDCFQGKTVFEDAIADEWKIVDLLYKISSAFPVIIQVSDSDGEFLLIEAANSLPKWLDPLSAEDRIFVYKNELHIVPRQIDSPTIGTSIEAILSLAETKASGKVQDAIYAKLSEHSTCQIQQTQIIVPHSVGHLLYYDPQLISHSVHAFYSRDPSAVKVCQTMDTFNPLKEKMIKMTVKMTRIMYAQLEAARFPVMKPFTMPSKNSPDYRAADLGMKIACGFEMLYRDPGWNQTFDDTTEYNFSIDEGWKKYQKRLEKIGYYRQEIEGSALYQILEKQAQEQYLADKLNDNEYMNTKNPVQVIKDILKLPLVQLDSLPQGLSDSDEWLMIDQTAEKDLASKFAAANLNVDDTDSDLDNVEEEELKNMSQWVGGFNDFINVKSGVSGALFPGETEEDVDDQDFDAKEFFNAIINTVGIQKSDVKNMGDKIDLFFDSDSELSDNDLADLTTESVEMEGDSDVAGDSFYEYLKSMNSELLNSKVGSSLPAGPESDQVKMDKNLIQNLLDSFSAQDGLPGPVSNILLSLNTSLPKKH